jgi:hypothetical protein
MAEEYVLKRGEVGTLLEFTLSDANGAVNLNGWTVTMTAKKGSADPVIDEVPCVLLPNQATTDKGKGTYEWDATTANIPAGTYNLEFKAVNPSGDVFYFPKTYKEPYAILRVVESLS